MIAEHDLINVSTHLLHKTQFHPTPSLCLLVAANESLVSISHIDRYEPKTQAILLRVYLCKCTVQVPILPNMTYFLISLAEVLCLGTSIAYACEDIDVAVA